jgi:predicted dehydrogenase
VSVVLDLMIHDLDLVSAAFDGARLIGVDAGPLRSGVDTDHAVEAHLSFEGGRTAVLTVDRFAPVQNRTTQLDYADGSLAIDFANRTVNSTRTGVAPGRFDTDDARLSDPLGYGVEAFLTAASGIAGPRPVTGRDAAYAVDLAEQVDAALMALRQTA